MFLNCLPRIGLEMFKQNRPTAFSPPNFIASHNQMANLQTLPTGTKYLKGLFWMEIVRGERDYQKWSDDINIYY